MKKTVLIVEDELAVRKFLGFYLEKYFTVITKDNGLEAMVWLEEGNDPDAIIADLNMPLMDGFEFIKRVRATARLEDIPFITLSGSEKSSDKITCLKIGADDYVVKPFNPEEILVRLNNILRRTGRLPK
ncbi:MAG: response regulator transcription factor [Bacteroidota bacterium]